MIQWHSLHHSELTTAQLYALLKLRSEVFVVEQNCLYQDIDGEDLVGENRHVLGISNGEIAAYARILKSDEPFDPVVIGRVLVSSQWRGRKIGEQLMAFTLDICQQHWPDKAIYLSAQAHLKAFYTRLGFSIVTPEYNEDGIPHIGMAKEPAGKIHNNCL